MAPKKKQPPKAKKTKSTVSAKRTPGSAVTVSSAPLKALPTPEPGPNPECGQPGGGRGRVEIIGRSRPRDIRIDPNVTEGKHR